MRVAGQGADAPPCQMSAVIGPAGLIIASRAGTVTAVLAACRVTSCNLPEVGFETDQRLPAERQLLDLLLHGVLQSSAGDPPSALRILAEMLSPASSPRIPVAPPRGPAPPSRISSCPPRGTVRPPLGTYEISRGPDRPP
jgi:hypothetical protein